MIAIDRMAVFFKGFLILTSFLVLLSTPGSRELSKSSRGEFYALLLGVTLGMMLLVSAVDMLMLFLALEMVSVSSYIMVGYLRNERQSNEASLKYILFGAVSTGSMLYGITLLFGLTGTTKMVTIRQFLAGGAGGGGNSIMLLVATVLILAGLRLQDGGRAVSLLVPGRLHRRAHARDRLPERGAEGGRIRGSDPLLFHRAVPARRPAAWTAQSSVQLDRPRAAPVGRHHDVRQHRRPAAGQHEAHAGLLVHRARRLHLHGCRGACPPTASSRS